MERPARIPEQDGYGRATLDWLLGMVAIGATTGSAYYYSMAAAETPDLPYAQPAAYLFGGLSLVFMAKELYRVYR